MKELVISSRQNVYVVEYDLDSFDDESNKVLAAEFVWPSKGKIYACEALKPVHKNWQEGLRFTFDVAKCDKFFDELHKHGYIKMSHTLLPLDELKQRGYYKWHNSYSYATNDCNIFLSKVQSAINERRLSLKDMQIDRKPFPMNTVDLNKVKVLVWPEQADTTWGKNVIISEKRTVMCGQSAIKRGGDGEVCRWKRVR